MSVVCPYTVLRRDFFFRRDNDKCMLAVQPVGLSVLCSVGKGLTAWQATRSPGQQSHPTMMSQLVSGAAGAVGSLATQLCKLKGAKMVLATRPPYRRMSAVLYSELSAAVAG